MALHVVNVNLRDRARWNAEKVGRSFTCRDDVAILCFGQSVYQVDVMFCDNKQSSYKGELAGKLRLLVPELTQCIHTDHSGNILHREISARVHQRTQYHLQMPVIAMQ